MSGQVLRVSRFERGSLWSSMDDSIREAMPEYRAQPGLEAVWFGRRGIAAGDERVIVTLWSSAAEEAGSLTIPEMLGDLDVVAPSRVVVSVVFATLHARGAPARVLRLYDGRTHRGQLDAYCSEAEVATRREIGETDGPHALVMTRAGEDRFLTLSVWSDWFDLEAWTGGKVDQPLAIFSRQRLAKGSATHFEVVESAPGAERIEAPTTR